MKNTLPPFWSDDFDMDLLKVFPGLLEKLGESASIPLWTVGHIHNGRLNHPSCWNTYRGLRAFFWTDEPQLSRNKEGWFSLGGFVDNALIVPCLWIEALRDAWPHAYILSVDDEYIWDTSLQWVQRDFQNIMFDLRGWQPRDTRNALSRIERDILRSTKKLQELLQLKARH